MYGYCVCLLCIALSYFRSLLCEYESHYCKIQDFDHDFYRQFALVICGLDSIDARRWMNATLHQMFDPEDPSTTIPLIDGGTEGFKGQSRVIVPGQSSCYECSMDMLTPKTAYPLCTIANTPRLPEHCIEWASVLEWPSKRPNEKLDADNPDHVVWLTRVATARAQEFNISGITYALTQGVIKNIIPAIASTNAIIAASCCNEAFKMVTSSASLLNNYMLYTGEQSVYTYTFEHHKNPDCLVCGSNQKAVPVEIPQDATLYDLMQILVNKPQLQLKKPSIRSSGRSLYMQAPPSLEEATRPNLDKLMKELVGNSGDEELVITDPALPLVLKIVLKFE
eukprot:Partr_v1_DN26284_c0_g1_i4_m48481 putative activating enzyme